jgi:hypothetical protein
MVAHARLDIEFLSIGYFLNHPFRPRKHRFKHKNQPYFNPKALLSGI